MEEFKSDVTVKVQYSPLLSAVHADFGGLFFRITSTIETIYEQQIMH